MTRWLSPKLWAAIGPGLFLVALAFHSPVISPDAVEMAETGRCLWLQTVGASACEGLELWFWPPLFPLIVGAISLVSGVEPTVVGVGLSALSWALVVWLVVDLLRLWIGERLPWACALFPPLLLAVPTFAAYVQNGEARGLGLAFLLLALRSTVRMRRSHPAERMASIRVGLCIAMACLCRPEYLLPSGLLLAWRVWVFRSPWAPGGFLLLMTPYWALLSRQAGQFTVTSRDWLANVGGWLALFPDEWVRMELAAGARDTPVRRVVSTVSDEADKRLGLEWGEVGTFAEFVFLDTLPVALSAFALVGAVVAWRIASRRLLFGILLVLAPSVGSLVLLRVGDTVLPLNNLLPFVVLLALFTSITVGWGVAAWSERASSDQADRVVSVLLICLCWWLAVRSPPPVSLLSSEAGAAATSWLGEQSTSKIGVTFASAPIVLRSGHVRTRIPAPWSVPAWLEQPPDRLVLSSLDLPATLASLRTMERVVGLSTEVVFEDDAGWVAVMKVTAPAADSQ